MPYSTNLLQKVVQLTLIREDEPLVHEFFDFMASQFDELDGIALYKIDQITNEDTLVLETFHGKKFEKVMVEFLQEFILANTKLEKSIQTVSGHEVLIKRANQDKKCIFFLIYLFSDSFQLSSVLNNEQETDFLSMASLENMEPKNEEKWVKIQKICHLSQIYANHHMMITLNDKDALTGLYNRKSFDRKLSRIIDANIHKKKRREKECGCCTCLAILDIDHFKHINDNYGHLYGDEVLLLFAQQMQRIFRGEDLLFRYGGEEFIVVLKDIKYEMAEQVLQRFRTYIEAYVFPQVLRVTVSIGLTRVDNCQMQSDIVDQADHALYYIKNHGRNGVGSYESLVEQGKLQKLLGRNEIELF